MTTVEAFRQEEQRRYDEEIAPVKKKIDRLYAENTAIVERQWMRVYNVLEVDCDVIERMTSARTPKEVEQDDIREINRRYGVKERVKS